MKKFDIISTIIIFVGTIALALEKITGTIPHFIIAGVTLVLLIACAIQGKKEWRVPALEVLYRVFFGISVIAGIVMAAGEIVNTPILIAHVVTFAIFAVLFIINLIVKLAGK